MKDLKYSGLGSEGTQEASGNTGSEVHRLLPISVWTPCCSEPGLNSSLGLQDAQLSCLLMCWVSSIKTPSVEEGCVLDGPVCPERPLRFFLRGFWEYPLGL